MLRAHYESPTPLLGALAKKLERDRANVCRKARELGLTDPRRPKVAQLSLNYIAPKGSAELRSKQSKAAKRRLAAYGHARGMLGKRHSPKTLERLAAASREMWADPSAKVWSEENRQRRSDLMHARNIAGGAGNYSRTRGGRRADLDGRYFRSAWEANYARYLRMLKARGEIADWAYEPKAFIFEAIKRGTRSYLPDFRVDHHDGHHEWHEVKGWMDAKSQTKLSRMAKYFPEEVLIVVGETFFRSAKKSGLAALVGGWE